MSTPGTRKSASLESRSSSRSRTAPPTTYASSPSEPTYSSTAREARREPVTRPDGGSDTADLVRVRLGHGHHYVLRPPRTTCLVRTIPERTQVHAEPL